MGLRGTALSGGREEKEEMIFTNHAVKRASERVTDDLNRFSAISIKALNRGLGIEDVTPGPLFDYFAYKLLRYGNEVRVYKNLVFVYNTQRVLITVHQLPLQYRRIARKFLARKKYAD
jgi:hypothetical protein